MHLFCAIISTMNISAQKIQEVAERGKQIYDEMKAQYEPKETGKFLAIDPETKDAYLGLTSVEALTLAKSKHPEGLFFVVKIGYDVAQTVMQLFLGRRFAL